MRCITFLLSAAFLTAGIHSAPIFRGADLAGDDLFKRTELAGDSVYVYHEDPPKDPPESDQRKAKRAELAGDNVYVYHIDPPYDE